MRPSFFFSLHSFLDPVQDIGHQQRIVFISRGCIDVSLAMQFWAAPQLAGLSRQRVLGPPAEFDIWGPHPQPLVNLLPDHEAVVKTAAHYEYRRSMHVGPREVFYFPPTIHIWKAFPYPPSGDAFNWGYMLLEGKAIVIKKALTPPLHQIFPQKDAACQYILLQICVVFKKKME